MTTYTEYTKLELNKIYTDSLAHLIFHCDNLGVEIDKVIFYMQGFCVTFKGYPHADAILHDGSYGRNIGEWETCGFPWDYDDVSVHTSAQLANMIYALNHNEDWECYHNSEEPAIVSEGFSDDYESEW